MQTACRSTPPRSGLHRARRRAAFTLVEVMIAFTILIVGLCAALATLQSGFKTIDSARCSTLAAQVMQSQIERLRLLDWTDLTSSARADVEIPVTDLVPTSASDIAGRFTLKQSIQAVPSRSGIVEIRLNVTWKGLGSIPHNRSFSTRYAKNGLYDYYFARR